MNLEVIRRVALARHLYGLAANSLRSNNDLHLFSAANLAQDAVEIFLIAVADHVGAVIKETDKFGQFFGFIEDQSKPKKLPFRSDLMRLNRVRADSKHHGIEPSRGDCKRLVETAWKFMDAVSREWFNLPFATISAVDLLDEGPCRNHLSSARMAFEQGDNKACLIECRKAMFVEVETEYDIRPLSEPGEHGLLQPFTKAPYYARSSAYIESSVTEPTEYIVLDHASVNADLLAAGADPTDFWNVLRLTPSVYKKRQTDAQWIVREQFEKLHPSFLQANAEHVLAAAIDVALALHNNRRAQLMPELTYHTLKFKVPNARLFSKADRQSAILKYVPDGVESLQASARVVGLSDPGPYWVVSGFELGLLRVCYVHDDDVMDGSLTVWP